MTQLLQQSKMPLLLKVILAVCIICGFISAAVILVMERAPTSLEHGFIFSGLFLGVVAGIVAYSYRKPVEVASTQTSSNA
ncbi:MAG: hypothetical protein EON60_06370 [Alphaproteobacteria bacterium]|nr:MAG: hypothetical protein EON60_06370 [Alphaproteobacteria bacterium]